MHSNIKRLNISIQTSIKNICETFPVPDFWKHVIIFWTHWEFRDEEQKLAKKEFIENDLLNEFIELSNTIPQINPIQGSLNMIFNEYDENTSNGNIKKRNKDNSKLNFEKIIDLAKNMEPLYKVILPSEEKYELKEPINGKRIGNYVQFKYKKIRMRKYDDFSDEGHDRIIERSEILGNILVQEVETD